MFKDIKVGDKVVNRDGIIVKVTEIDNKLHIFRISGGDCHWMSDGKLDHSCEQDADVVKYCSRGNKNKLMKNKLYDMINEIREKVDTFEKLVDEL